MNIPTQSAQGAAASTDYQSLYGARSEKNTFEQTFAETLSSSLALTTAEGDLVTLSGLSQSYQQTQGASWFSPASSGIHVASSAMTAEAMGFSVQGDLNAQELGDITRLVGELTSIASTFFSGDHEGAMTRAMEFGNLGLGSISSLSASFSRQTVTQTRISSYSSLPAMTEDNAPQGKDLSKNQKIDQSKALDYAQLLEARWQQILKALDENKEHTLDGILTRRTPPQPEPNTSVIANENHGHSSAEKQQGGVPASVSASEQAGHQMLGRMQELLRNHPKLTPLANSLASTAMEKAAARSPQPHPVIARAFGELQNTFRNQLQQWLFAPEVPTATTPLTTA
ncbi:hypothetical protein [Thiovibrio frasassiensis]|uniref:DUF5610 domain-containing protein n=1 Tax=Thiovibrio frasassiensis TaxID=2984131 RepID=A0A9X4MFN0_9BACT|nr:hypothetical protein [Thiovibrio frasassiensis]MDG4475473.1 hypothetical protein [Thiovibrio frasassiensis]